MRRGLAQLLRQGHRLAEKRRCRRRRRGNNEQPNFQNVRLCSSSSAFVLIWALQLVRWHMAKTSRFWGSRFERNSNHWQLDCVSGKAPDFSGKNPLESQLVCPTRTEDEPADPDPLGCPRHQPGACATETRLLFLCGQAERCVPAR